MFALLALLAPLAALAAPISEHKSLVGRGFNGKATFYTPGDSNPNFMCGGFYSSPNQPIVALDMSQMDMSLCGKWITINYNGATARAQVTDGCETCSFGDVDLSPGVISQLTPDWEALGRFDVSWSFDGEGDSQPKPEPTSEPKPEPKPEPTPEPKPEPTPEPTPTPTPEPSTSSEAPPSSSEAPSSSTSSTVPSSSIAPSSSIISSASVTSSTVNASTNATQSISATSAPLNQSSPAASVAASATAAIVTGTGPAETGNLANLNQVVAFLGSLVIQGAK